MSVGRIRLRIRPDQSVQMRPALSLHIRHHLCCEQCRFQSEYGLLPGTDECCLHLNVGQPNSTHVLSEKVAPHFFQLSPHATPCSIFPISIHINYFQRRYDPQICGSNKKCPYLNLCLAKAAGFTDAQCNPPPPCTLDVKICPTGEVYQRSPLLDCRFPPCPDQTCPLGESIAGNCLFLWDYFCNCILYFASFLTTIINSHAKTSDILRCPNGEYVSRNPENGCRFDPCTTACPLDIKVRPRV